MMVSLALSQNLQPPAKGRQSKYLRLEIVGRDLSEQNEKRRRKKRR